MKKNEFQPGFRLNLRIIADALDQYGKKIEYYGSGDSQTLTGVRLYALGIMLKPEYVYFISSGDLVSRAQMFQGIPMVISGKINPGSLPENTPAIIVLDADNPLEIFSMVQDVFDRMRQWDIRIQASLSQRHPLQEILDASKAIFNNPMFIHNNEFVILAETGYRAGMAQRDRDKRSGQTMVALSTINDFKTDAVYQKGLREKHADMFPSEQTGYRILFRNLWNADIYLGRILVNEIDSSIIPGDYLALDYLGDLLEYYLQGGLLKQFSIDNDADHLLISMCDGEQVDERQIMDLLQFQRWNRTDRYICMRIVTEQKDFNLISSYAVLNQIEYQISTGHAFFHENGITVVVNLSYNHEKPADAVSRIAVLMREGLLKIGVSSEIRDFYQISKAYNKAKIALEFGRISSSMYWYYYFDDFMLDYMAECAGRDIPGELLCSSALRKLREYDQKNNSELYETLLVYLEHERNVLRTANELFIHRSTLTYRLERIQKLIGVDLNKPEERLKLLVSYYIVEPKARRREQLSVSKKREAANQTSIYGQEKNKTL